MSANSSPQPLTSSRPKKVVAGAAALACGGLGTVTVFQLTRSPEYLGPASLIGAMVAAVATAILSRDDVSIVVISRLATLAIGGAGAALLGYYIFSQVYTPSPESGLKYVQPANDAYQDVHANGTASFDVTVPTGYDKLTIAFSATDTRNQNCVPESSISLTPIYGTEIGTTQELPTGETYPITIPQGLSSFTLQLRFNPPAGYAFCDEHITVSSAQFTS